MMAFLKVHDELYQRSNGWIGHRIPFAPPMLLLHSVGAKTGQRRTHSLAYYRDGNDYLIVASNGGADRNPAWYHNLVAHPEVTVELPGQTYAARARVAEGEERERLFRAQADLMPNFDQYQAKTTRVIPVVVLERV